MRILSALPAMFLEELQRCKYIHFVEKISVEKRPDFVVDSKKQKQLKAKLRNVEVYRFIYTVGKLKVVGYLALPKVGEKMPCLIHLRGGSKDFGMITTRSIVGQLVTYANEGYIVITTQYPGVEGGDGRDTFGGSDDLSSITRLRDILKCMSVADTAAIGVKGHSRGGLMTYMLLRKMSWIKAAMIAGAPVDQMDRAGDRKGWREHQIEMWGGDKKGCIERSPILWADELPKKVPILLMHGSADWRVLPRHSVEMVTLLLKYKIPHRFVLFEGADHGITEYKQEYHAYTIEWFNRFLKRKEALPNMKPHGE